MYEMLLAKQTNDFGDVIEMLTVVKDGRRSYIVQLDSCGIKSRKEFNRSCEAYDLYKAAM